MTHDREIFSIRHALPADVPRLRAIEDEAGALFSGSGLIDEALDVSFPLGELTALVALGSVWVACTANDLPVGLAIASLKDGAVYLEEMDVLPMFGRRGLGTRLLEHVCSWARQQGHPAVTLSTFLDVPWNGPFYRKHGFRELAPQEWSPSMHLIRQKETGHGLRVEARVFMRRDFA